MVRRGASDFLVSARSARRFWTRSSTPFIAPRARIPAPASAGPSLPATARPAPRRGRRTWAAPPSAASAPSVVPRRALRESRRRAQSWPPGARPGRGAPAAGLGGLGRRRRRGPARHRGGAGALLLGRGARLFEAQRDDELRDVGRRVDVDLHVVDERLALRALVHVLELERAPDLEELQVGSHRQLARAGVAHARLHGRAEPLDVEAHPRAAGRGRLLGGGLVGGVAERHAHGPHGAGGGLVEADEAQAELAALRLLVAPQDLAVHGDLRAHPVEAADELLAHLGEVGGAEPHPVRGDVDRLGLEARAVLAHGDQRLEVEPLPTARAAFSARVLRSGTLCASNTHTPSPPDRAALGLPARAVPPARSRSRPSARQ